MGKRFATLIITTMLGIIAVGGNAFGLGSTALGRPDGRGHDEAVTVASVDEPLRVLLMGDSLTHEAGSAFTFALTMHDNAEVDASLIYGGTAICDWLVRLEPELQRFRPQVAVVEFSGNSLTPCMTDPTTGTSYSGDAKVEKYRLDAHAAMAIFARYDVTVYWVEAPVTKSSSTRPLAPVYMTMPWTWPNAQYVNAGAAVLADGAYTDYLPCLPVDPCTETDPATGQLAAKVRAPDGGHFCPTAPEARRGVTGDCPVWSSGAWRFGTAMAAAVIVDYGLAEGRPPRPTTSS